jgi:hypothetical protein
MLSLILIGLFWPGASALAQSPADSASVNGEIIAIRVEHETFPMSVFQNRVEKILNRTKAKAKQSNREFDTERAREEIVNSLKKRLLSRLILDAHADIAGATVPQKQIRNQISKRIQLAGSKEAFRKQIEKRGMTMEQFREQLREKLRRKNFVQQEIGPITVTDTEIEKVYQDNKKRLSRYNKARAMKVLREKIKRAKNNRKSKDLVSRLREKSDIEINI